MLPSYISVLLAVGLIVIEAWLNARKFRQNITINKIRRNVMRSLIGAAFAYITYLDFLYGGRYFVFLATLFLALFNPIIGKMWKNDWWYLNGTDWTDIFLAGLPKWIRIVWLGVILSIGFIVWQLEYFSSLTIGILEPGFLHQFVEYAYLLI
jgi:hypothetical protein